MKGGLKIMFRTIFREDISFTEKVTAFLLLVAPVLIESTASSMFWGEAELPARYKK